MREGGTPQNERAVILLCLCTVIPLAGQHPEIGGIAPVTGTGFLHCTVMRAAVLTGYVGHQFWHAPEHVR